MSLNALVDLQLWMCHLLVDLSGKYLTSVVVLLSCYIHIRNINPLIDSIAIDMQMRWIISLLAQLDWTLILSLSMFLMQHTGSWGMFSWVATIRYLTMGIRESDLQKLLKWIFTRSVCPFVSISSSEHLVSWNISIGRGIESKPQTIITCKYVWARCGFDEACYVNMCKNLF